MASSRLSLCVRARAAALLALALGSACSVYDRSLLGAARGGTGTPGSGGADDGGSGVGGSSDVGGGASPGASGGGGAGGAGNANAGRGGETTGTSGASSGGAGGGIVVDPCRDGLHNGRETDVDCGGSECGACPVGRSCSESSDCASLECIGGVCTTIDCTDDTKNGRETAIDCGGEDCPPCGPGGGCAEHGDCDSSVCTERTCTLARTCRRIQDAAPDAESGIYLVDPEGDGGEPIGVYCDMLGLGGGWTRVGFEPAGAGGSGIQGALSRLGVLVGTASDVASGSGAALIGALFDGAYTEVRLSWAAEYVRFTPAAELFADTPNTALAISAFAASNADLNGWIAAAGAAVFCRASTSAVHPGDTSWAVKPSTSTDDTCGCNGMAWVGEGAFYGGAIPADPVCDEWGGAWAGVRASGQQKGGLASSVDLALWIR